MPNTMVGQLQHALAQRRSEIEELTRELIAIPTENPPGKNYRECVSALEAVLRHNGLECEVIEVPAKPEREQGIEESPRYCLLAYYGSGPRTVYFHGHYDVVPANERSQFTPEDKDGRLYGRGSADMKGGLVAMIYAVKAIQDCGIDVNGRIGLVFVPDEETGGVHGAQYLAEQGLLGREGIAAFTPEPTSGVIWNANRGALSVRVTVHGRPIHVALHYQGVNALDEMLAVIGSLRELKNEVELERTSYNINPEQARHSILMIGGQIGGGTNFNTVPGQCWFTVDRRINPEEDLDIERRKFEGVISMLKKKGRQIDCEILQEGLSAGFPENHPVAQTLAASVESVTGERPDFEMCPGLLETRFYAQQGIPSFGYGPGLLEVAHGPDEYVEVGNIVDCAAVYALAAIKLLNE